jgi:hypothetical protein
MQAAPFAPAGFILPRQCGGIFAASRLARSLRVAFLKFP